MKGDSVLQEQLLNETPTAAILCEYNTISERLYFESPRVLWKVLGYFVVVVVTVAAVVVFVFVTFSITIIPEVHVIARNCKKNYYE